MASSNELFVKFLYILHYEEYIVAVGECGQVSRRVASGRRLTGS